MKMTALANILIFLCLFGANFAVAQDIAIERGEQTYMRVGCYECHGTDGKGNEAGPPLTPDTLPPEAIANFVRFSPGRMPVYPEEILSDAEISDIVAYLDSVKPSPDADSIDILRGLVSEEN
ncbi:MAG: cytochrome c [Rhodospirillaceae bacterium]|nr:cytochrome c [Rhodospirillaceae bacterium]